MPEKHEKEITLPESGRVVTIRRCGILTLQRIKRAMPDVSMPETPADTKPKLQLTEDQQDRAYDATIDLVCRCCVEPRFSACEVGTEPDGTESIDVLPWEDYTALQKAVEELNDFEGKAERLRPLSKTG